MKAIVDCNSFYCACERVFEPKLARRPVVVLSNNDGCIVSRTDEAKALGVPMAAPFYQARDLINENGIAVFSSNYNLYGDMSRRVMDVLRFVAGEKNVEVYSVDEAFVDLEGYSPEQLQQIAIQFRDTVFEWTGIEVSVGIAPTKTLSKIANNLAKKNKQQTGCVVVLDTDEKITVALEQTLIGDVWGIGRQYARKLRDNWCIYTAGDLRGRSAEWGRKNMGGVTGMRLLRELNGEQCIEMKDPLEKKKMIATTRMFGRPVFTLHEIKEAVATYTSRAAEKLRRQQCVAGFMDVFVVSKNRNEDSGTYIPAHHHLGRHLPVATSATDVLIKNALELTEQLFRQGGRYIKTGVILGAMEPESVIQKNIFTEPTDPRAKQLMAAMDNINFSMRNDVVKYAATGLSRNWKMRQEHRSGRYTSRWEELREVR